MWPAAEISLLTAVDTDRIIVWPWSSLTGWRITRQKVEKCIFC